MAAVIRGQAGDDDLTGTTGNDIFNLTLGGNDTVHGGQGHDIFWLGGTLTAADKIDGGTGDDRVNLNGDYSGAHALTFAADTMVNVEHLYLAGGHSYDLTMNDATLAAGGRLSVNATLLGAGDHLIFDGSAETDGRFNIFDGHGDDTITGGAKADVIDLEVGGDDIVHGGGGNDLIFMGSKLTAADQIDGGTGFDVIELNGMGGDDSITFNAATLTNVEALVLDGGHFYTLTTDEATVAAGEQLIVDGSALGAGDALTFNGAAETDGSFYLLGGAGNDVITGGQGSDSIDLSTGGNDTLTLGGGFNIVQMGAELTAADKIAGGSGIDAVLLAGAYEGIHAVTFNATTMTGVESLVLMRGFSYELTSHDATVASGEVMTVDATLLSFLDSAKFDGSAETDGAFDFFDGAGNDTFKGGAGEDLFSFEAGGHDTGQGGGGNDFFDACGKFDSADQFDGGSGYDVIELDASQTPHFRYAFDHALNITAAMLSNFEEMDLDGGGNYTIATADGVVAAGVSFKVDATFLDAGDILNFDGSAETDGGFEFDLDGGTYHLTGGAQNDVFKVGADFAPNDRIDGGGFSGGDGNRVEFDGDYTGANALVLGTSTIKNIQNLAFDGGHTYDITTDDANFAAGDTVVIDGTNIGAGHALIFDALAETDATLNFYGGAGNDVLTGGTGQINYFDMGAGGTDAIHTNFSIGGQNFIAMFDGLTAADTIDAQAAYDEVTLEGDYTGVHAVVFGATTMTGVDTLRLVGGFSYDLTTNDATVDSFLNPSLTVDSTDLQATDTLAFDGSAESDCNFVFNAGAETDTLVGGAFGDTFNMGANLTAADSIDGGGGIDQVNLDGDYSGAHALVLGATTLKNITFLTLAAGHLYDITTNDATVASGATLTVDSTALTFFDGMTFTGTAELDGHFTIKAGASDDAIWGGQAGDTFDLSLGGDDFVVGGSGNDQFDLGATFTASDTINGGGGSFDTVVLDGDYSSQLSITGTMLTNVEDLVVLDGHSYNLKLADGSVVASGMVIDGGLLTGGNALTFDGSAETGGSFIIYTGTGDDVVTGGGGAFGDQINLKGGTDTVHAGGGDDAILAGGSLTTADVIDGGTGNDELVLSGDYSTQLVIANVSNVEEISLSSGHDYDIKIANDAVLAGLSMLGINASALGASNTLTLDGSAVTTGAFDVVDGAGDDSITTGGGNDTIQFNAALTAADKIDGGTGIDTLALIGNYSAGLTFSATTMINVEQINLFGAFDYKLTLNNANVAAGQTLTVSAIALGGGHILTFDGSAETDGSFTITGGTGDDVLTGGALNDGFNLTQGGNDTAQGGAGNDTFSFGAAFTAADTVDGGANTDTISLSGDYSAGLTLGATTLTSIENIVTNVGHDYDLTTVDANVASGATLTVNASALGAANGLTFDGSAEIDGKFNVMGGAGDDDLTGGAGNDSFTLGAGINDVTGGMGADTITAGGTVDRFHYASAAESTSTTYDTINGLDAANDFFDLDVSPTQFDGTHDSSVAIDNGATFDAQLALASAGFFVVGGALVVNAASGGTLAGHSFLIVDADSDGVYTGGTDYVFDITGYSGPLAIGNFI